MNGHRSGCRGLLFCKLAKLSPNSLQNSLQNFGDYSEEGKTKEPSKEPHDRTPHQLDCLFQATEDDENNFAHHGDALNSLTQVFHVDVTEDGHRCHGDECAQNEIDTHCRVPPHEIVYMTSLSVANLL